MTKTRPERLPCEKAVHRSFRAKFSRDPSDAHHPINHLKKMLAITIASVFFAALGSAQSSSA